MSQDIGFAKYPDRDAKGEEGVYTPPGGPPPVPRPSPEIFAAMGEAGIEAMLADVYAELERSSIRRLFPRNMQRASLKSAAFFIGLLGGPPRYHERYGPPMMRARHLPFAIDEAARREWLACFERVLERSADYGFPAEQLPDFRAFLEGFSAWMVNRRGPVEPRSSG